MPTYIQQFHDSHPQVISAPDKNLMDTLSRLVYFDRGNLASLKWRTLEVNYWEKMAAEIGDADETYRQYLTMKERVHKQTPSDPAYSNPGNTNLLNTWNAASSIIEAHVRAAFLPEKERQSYMGGVNDRLRLDYLSAELALGTLSDKTSHLERDDLQRGLSTSLQELIRVILDAKTLAGLRQVLREKLYTLWPPNGHSLTLEHLLEED